MSSALSYAEGDGLAKTSHFVDQSSERDQKMSDKGRLKRSAALTLFWDFLHISETNHARKLKFGTLVGIYSY